MSLPVKAKTWLTASSINIAYGGTGTNAGDCKDLSLKLKNLLKAFSSNPWTVGYSCDSSVAGAANDGVDRLAAVGNIVSANAGSAHSWIVFKQGGGGTVQLLWDWDSTNPYQASISVSQSAGFTGGSTTAAPTATDQCPLNSATAGTPANWGPGNSAHTGTFHVMQSSDGFQLRVVFCSGGNAMGAWVIGAPAGTPAGWSNPIIGWVFATGSTSTEGPLYANMTRAQNARGRVGANNFAAFLSCEGVNASEVNATIAGASDIDSSYPMSGIGIISTVTAGTRGRLGTLVDCWCGLASVATASSYGSKQFAQFGDLILPWDGSTTPSAS